MRLLTTCTWSVSKYRSRITRADGARIDDDLEAHEFMGCLSRLLVLIALAIQVIAGVLALVVLGSAGVLGSAAVMNSEDAMIIFVAIAFSLLATLFIALKMWMNSRIRKRLENELAACQSQHQARYSAAAES